MTRLRTDTSVITFLRTGYHHDIPFNAGNPAVTITRVRPRPALAGSSSRRCLRRCPHRERHSTRLDLRRGSPLRSLKSGRGDMGLLSGLRALFGRKLAPPTNAGGFGPAGWDRPDEDDKKGRAGGRESGG